MTTIEAYDPLGRIRARNTSVVGQVYMLEEGDHLIAEYNANGLIASGGNPANPPLRRYVYVPGQNEPIVWYEGTTPYWLHADREGSIIAWSDASGVVTGAGVNRTANYGPYGESSTANMPRFGYTGQAFWSESNLYYYKARLYSPALGRFLQTDPIGYEAGDTNLYAYVGDDPENKADPTGLAGCGTSSGGGAVGLTGGECDAWMAKQATALKDVTATRAGLAAYRSDPKSAAGASFAKAATAALGSGALSDKNLAKLDRALGKFEAFYKDPGTAHGGKYDVYRAAGWSNGGTIINGQVAFGSGYFSSRGSYSRLSTIHEPMHLPGFGVGRDMSAIFPNGALGRVGGDPYWDRWYAGEHPAGAQSNVDNWACLISQQCK